MIWEKLISWVAIAAISAVIILPGQHANGRRNKLTLKPSVSKQTTDGSKPWQQTLTEDQDSLKLAELTHDIVLSGFDKTLTSTKETFFVTNGTPHDIHRMVIEIIYTDTEGRQLHKRNVTVKAAVPAGETRMLDIKTFDTQKSFYYRDSTPPRRRGTPFDIRMRIISLTIDAN